MTLEPGFYWTVRTPACLPVDLNEEPQPRKWDGDGWVAARTRYFWQDFTPVSPRLVWPLWRPIAELKSEDDQVLAITADGRAMVWKVALLLRAMQSTAPAILQFPATHYMLIPEGPKV